VVGRPLVLAHRGACLAAPENTLAAFALARDAGADGVELDVHATADGALVVHHDAEANGIGLLVDHSLRDVRAARPDIPTLAECFGVLGDLIVNVEIKCCAWDPDPDPDHRVAAAVVELVHELDALQRVVVSSFDLGHIDAVRSLDAAVATGFLIHGHDPAGAVTVCADRGHGWLHPDWGNLALRLDESMHAAREAGIRLDPWTIDDPEVMRRFAAAGVDAFITNDPSLALTTLTVS